MVSPIDYSINVESPFQSVLQGFKVGDFLQQRQVQQQQQQLAQQQAQQQAAAQTQMQADLGAVAGNPNASGADYAGLMTKYPKLSENLKRSWDVLDTSQRQAKLEQMSQVHAALKSGKPQVAKDYLQTLLTAAQDGGDERTKAGLQALIQQIDIDPEATKVSTGISLIAQVGPEKYAEAYGKFGAEERAQELQPSEVKAAAAKAGIAEAEKVIKTEESKIAAEVGRLGLLKTKQEIANIGSQISERSRRLKLDQDKLATETALKLKELNQKSTELTGDAKKLINDSAVASVAADNSAQKMISLADRLETSGASSGFTAKGSEMLKNLMGSQDAISELRQEYTRLRSTQVSKMLPPGPASDKDIQLALQGFPSENANPKTMASFVRGMAKLSNYEAAVESAKSEWVNSVGHLGRPKGDIVIDGTKVPAGTTFADFSKLKVQQNADARQAEQEAAQVQNRSYMKYANPAGQ